MRVLLAALLALVALTGAVFAQGGPALDVTGRVAHPGRLDRAALAKLEPARIVTATEWTQGRIAFEGVRMRDLLRAVGAQGREVLAVALNDYRTTIPVADFDAYDVILAWRRDGQDMSVRDRGPFWIVYPFDQHGELRHEPYLGRSIWQLKSLEVR
jgi:hypothetical protein